MSSTSMPPPPSPLARRRTHPNQPSASTTCLPRNMSLSKGASFHVASSPYTDEDPVLSIPHLARRSPTCSHASLVSLLSEKRELAAQHIADFEQTFSGARGNRRSSRRKSAEEFNQQLKSLRAALPTDEGLGSSIGSPASDKGISKTLAQVELASNKDSALGDSVAGSVVDADRPAATVLVQETDKSDNTAVQTRQAGNEARQKTSNTHKHTLKPSYLPSSRTAYHPALSRFARKKITELVIQPILREERFKDFHSLVTSLASRTHKNIRCLRDLEQSLIFQPLARNFSVSPSLYRSFGEFTVQLTVDTFQHLSDSDQRRTTDQAYTSGYFLDLVQQINQLAAHIGSSSRATGTETEEGSDAEAPSLDDEITLEGGISNTGELAELVRWKNGKGISLRTGLPYEPLPGIKRQASSMTQEEIARSMARRKKGYIPEIVEMKCSDPTCDKIFTRKCDLAKHEKTHSRPFKCPYPTCKYSEVGLPTEKEKERHINDKHDPNPTLYRCQYCEFKTKRESNCKQHMEKKHGWEYRRAKGKDKDTSSTPAQTPHTPAMDFDFNTAVVQPSPAQVSYHGFEDGSSVSGSAQLTPYDEAVNDMDTFNSYSAPLFPRHPQQQSNQFVPNNNNFGFDATTLNSGFDQFNGYASPVSTGQNVKMTPATPAFSTITGNSPYLSTNNNNNNFGNPCYGWNEGLPTPDSAVHQSYSRHPSVQYESPSNFGMERTLSNHMTGQQLDDMIGGGDFQLFDPAFSNPSARNETLFPAADEFTSRKFTVADFEAAQMELDLEDYAEPIYRENDFDDLVNFDN